MFSFLAFTHLTRNMGESVHMCECSCLFVNMHMPTHVPARALKAAAVCVYVRVCVCVCVPEAIKRMLNIFNQAK